MKNLNQKIDSNINNLNNRVVTTKTFTVFKNNFKVGRVGLNINENKLNLSNFIA